MEAKEYHNGRTDGQGLLRLKNLICVHKNIQSKFMYESDRNNRNVRVEGKG